jgi:hypothetical protein
MFGVLQPAKDLKSEKLLLQYALLNIRGRLDTSEQYERLLNVAFQSYALLIMPAFLPLDSTPLTTLLKNKQFFSGELLSQLHPGLLLPPTLIHT